ncbi:hypothetical protein Kpol_480p1 [Vanderwaltozyma polyspora DSM 70294]|uniref:Aminotransferase class I/classII large domain-containing protein n=1 Tax=Vanderwaltozyma polyspora (strain ATCC 22028 / DSM 70294 / BCRC 21397 / CBS 2163 / NBRC 10782 / NRRL Y-8283 / UCD 57-17) TaxID=436907 RepID=A7TP63_VANPO|nr:uncharacterized protein Kpol_480p1 [Vanderwaltozyma polyspora DSM 70294]EDO15914.1 hypothetical protein Kpol_480p1 [Vanderwaltozyma polyspora DSM 70294]
MPFPEDFAVEPFMDKHETNALFNLGETCCYSLSLDEIEQLSGNKFNFNTKTRLSYGAIKGSDELRTSIASLYGPDFTMDDILLTNGAIGANFLAFYTLVGAGDHVICVEPTYSQLYSVPEMFGAEVDLLTLKKEDDFLPNLQTLKSMIKNNTKLIIINNPNNPLGSVIKKDLLKQICKLCEENDIYLHSDEVYRPIFHSLEDEMVPPSACELYSKAIVSGSMSKAYSVAGIRLGWLVSKDKQFLRDAASRRDYNMISVSMIDDQIAQYVLDNREYVIKRNYELCLNNFRLLNDFMDEHSDKFEFYHKPTAATVCLAKVKGVNDTMKFATFLAEKYGVLAVPGEAFGVPGTIRIGYCNSEDDIKLGLKHLADAYIEWLKIM